MRPMRLKTCPGESTLSFQDASVVITKKAAKILEELVSINQKATHVLEANTTKYHQRLRVRLHLELLKLPIACCIELWRVCF